MARPKITLIVSSIFLISILLVFTVSAGSNEALLRKIFKIDKKELAKAEPIGIEIENIVNNLDVETYEISDKQKEVNYERILEEIKESKDGITRVMVWFNEGESIDKFLKENKGLEVIFEYDQLNGLAVFADEREVNNMIESDMVWYIVNDEKTHKQLWNSRALINADQVENNLGLTGQGITVCHLDSGINYTSPYFANSYVGGYDFANNDNDPMDDEGHGSHTAGIITMTGHPLLRGIAPNAGIAAVKVLDSNGNGFTSITTAGLNWCLANKNLYNIKVVSMSMGTFSLYTPGSNPGFYDPALQALHLSGIPTITSSGNDGSTTQLDYPSVSPHTISVSATSSASTGSQTYTFGAFSCSQTVNVADVVMCFSNRASFLDLMGPGAIIASVRASGTGSTLQGAAGTSAAAPHVTGTIALMLEKNPNLSPEQIRTILTTTGIPVLDTVTGLTFPRVDALAAVNAVPSLTASGPLAPNTVITFNIDAPMHAGETYVLALSTSSTPGINLPDGRVIPLNVDWLLDASIYFPMAVGLGNNIGVLDANGQATATLWVPNAPGIGGVDVPIAYITLDPTVPSIPVVSNSVTL